MWVIRRIGDAGDRLLRHRDADVVALPDRGEPARSCRCPSASRARAASGRRRRRSSRACRPTGRRSPRRSPAPARRAVAAASVSTLASRGQKSRQSGSMKVTITGRPRSEASVNGLPCWSTSENAGRRALAGGERGDRSSRRRPATSCARRETTAITRGDAETRESTPRPRSPSGSGGRHAGTARLGGDWRVRRHGLDARGGQPPDRPPPTVSSGRGPVRESRTGRRRVSGRRLPAAHMSATDRRVARPEVDRAHHRFRDAPPPSGPVPPRPRPGTSSREKRVRSRGRGWIAAAPRTTCLTAVSYSRQEC